MPFNIIWEVLVVLAFAVFLGEIFEQFGLPSVAGELLSGLILGPTVIGLVASDTQIQAVSSISLFFIIYLIGLEMKTETLRKFVPKASFVTMTSFVIPALVTAIISMVLYQFGLRADLIIALAISVPSISIISVMVMQYELQKTDVGQIILASVVITDISAFIVLAGLSESIGSTLYVLIYVFLFIAIFVVIDVLLNLKASAFRRMLRVSSKLFRREDISYAILIVFGLLIAQIFQLIGMSYIIGAFFAGLILHDRLIGREAFGRISRTFTRVNRGFFIPLFFGFAGVEAKPFLPSQYSLVLILLLLVLSSVGIAIPLTYYGAKHVLKVRQNQNPELKRFSTARQIAVILSGKGAVGIVIMTVAFQSGLVDITAYSLVILGTIIVSIVSPLMLRRKAMPGLPPEE
ncbi:MAG: cation:proton antiporter [Nitrososphaerales archaeon]